MSLREKLLNVMTECAKIGKDGYNNTLKYNYVTAAKVNDIVNASLVKNKIATTSKATLLDIREVETSSGKKVRLATVAVEITLRDVEGEETMTISGVGSGQDFSDKGVAKAQTMAVKYAWKSALLIADAGDDADADSSTDSSTTFVQTDKPGGKPIDKAANTKIAGKCEKCGKSVTESVASYCEKQFGGHVYCYDCQKEVRKGAARTADIPF